MRARRDERLHLLEVGLRWPPETFLCWKLEGLAARGLRVTVASRSIFEEGASLDGVELVALPQRGAPPAGALAVAGQALLLLITAPRRLYRLVAGIRRLPAARRRRYGGIRGLLAQYLPLAALHPDVVHIEWNQAATLYRPLFEVWGCPVVASCHGSEVTADPYAPGQETYAELLADALRSSTAVHCVSDSLRRAVLDLGVDPAMARVIRQGVDTALFRPASRRGDQPVLRITAIGWPRWVKGFEWALEAMRILLDSGVPAHLEILGAGPVADAGEPVERARLRHTLADLRLEQQVHLAGRATSQEVARRLAESDVLLLPSLDEGLPTVVLEAMACALPVVATECGGISEAVTDGVEGFVVPPRDAPALAAALERLWHEPDRRLRMGQAARRTATSSFRLERQLDEFLALYREVVGP